jgi:hypothetical protein
MLLLDPEEPGTLPTQLDRIPVRAVLAVKTRVVRHVCKPVPLGVLEQKLSFGEPSLARGAVFEQIHVGRINDAARGPERSHPTRGRRTLGVPGAEPDSCRSLQLERNPLSITSSVNE